MSSSNYGTQIDRVVAPDYNTVGSILKLKDDTEFYATGTARGKRGVILISDTIGWNSGRIRNIADFFGDNDCLAVIPKLMGTSKAAEGPSITSVFTHPLDYVKDTTIEGNLKPKVCSLVKYMQKEGIEKIALVGFSWGGWVVTHLLASDIAENFVCGALPHPSINLEERVFGGSLINLMSRIERPILLMPTKGDPEDYQHYLKMLKHKLPTSADVDYYNMEHGFLLRGNLNDREVHQAVVQSLSQIMDFFNHHFEMDPSQLVQGVGKAAKEFTEGVEHPSRPVEKMEDRGEVVREIPGSVSEQMRQGYEQTKEGAQNLGQRAQEGAQQALERTKETAQQAAQRIQEGWDATKQRTAEGYEKTKEGTQQAWDATKQRTAEGYEGAKERTQQAGEKVQEGWDATKQRTAEGYEKTKEGTQQAWDATKQRTAEGYEGTKERTQQAGERMQEGWDKTKEGAQQAGERAQEGWDQTKQRTQEGWDKTKEGAQQSGERAQEGWDQTKQRTQEGWDKTKEGAQQAGERAQEGWDKTKQRTQEGAGKTKEGAQQAGERAQEGWDKTKERSRDTGEKAGQAAGKAGERAGENIKQASEGVKARSQSQEDRSK
eukprot:gene5197-5720_t